MAKGSGRWTNICGIFLLLALALYYYLPSAYFLYSVRSDSRNKPELWQIPQPLIVKGAVLNANRQISFRGVQFSSPWGDEKVLRDFKRGGLMTFGESRTLLFLSVAETPTNYRSLALDGGKNEKFMKLVGEQAMKSNFDCEREILKTTPNLGLSFNPIVTSHRAMFLFSKEMEAYGGKTGIYEFRTEHIRGFQKGNPGESNSVILDVYDRSDRFTKIIVAGTKNAKPPLSQDEVNVFISSLLIDANEHKQSNASK